MEAGDAPNSRPERIRAGTRSVESAAIAGVVYAVLAAVGLGLLRRFPDLTLSDRDLAAWFDDADNRGSLVLALNLAAISSIAFLWFVAVIRRRLGEREDRFFASVFFGSAIAYVAIWVAGAALAAAPAVSLTIRDTGTVEQDTATLAHGSAAALLLVAAPRLQAVFVLTTSTLVLRTGALPKWLAYLGYLIGLALFTVPLVTEPLGLGLPAYVLIVSVTILFLSWQAGRRSP